MKAAMLTDKTVANIIAVDNENFKRLRRMGYTVLAAEPLGLEIGDYTEDGTMFFRDVPVFDVETGEQTGVEKRPLPLEENDTADMLAALNALGVSAEEGESNG